MYHICFVLLAGVLLLIVEGLLVQTLMFVG